MDFTARIVAKLDTSEAKAELNNFIKKANDPIKLNVEIDKSDFSELSKQFNGIGTKLGRELSLNLNKAINSNKFEVDIDFAKTQANIKSKTEKLARDIQRELKDSNISIDSKTANKFANKQIKEYDASVQARIKQAKTEAKELEKIQKQISQRSLEVSSSSIKKTLDKYAGSNSKIYGDLEQSYNKLINLQKELTSGVENKSLSKNELLSKFNEFYNVLEKCNNEAKILGNETANISKAFNRSDAITAGNKTLIWLKNNSKAAKEYGEELKQLASLQKNSFDDNELKNYTKQVNRIKAKASAEGKTGLSFGAELKRAASQIGQFVSVYGVFQRMSDLFVQSVADLKEIDNILTEISKTSDLTSAQLKELGKNSFDAASVFGKTAQEYLTGIQEMSRSGFYGKQAEDLAKVSIMAQAAGDMTSDVSNSYLLATNAAYGYKGSVEQLTAVLDGQNMISNRNSVSMGDLAEATTQAGSMAAQAGVQVNQLSALVGTAVSRTKKSGNEIGTALKALFINLQNTQNDKITSTFKDLGISMTKMVGDSKLLKTPIELLRELSTVYNSLPEGSEQKSNILTNIGGKHHANVLSSILSGMDDYDKMIKDYSEGSGSAALEAEKSANNWSGSLNKLKNSWTELTNVFVDSDFAIGAIQGLDKITNSVTDLINTVGVLPTILGGVGIGSFFKNLDKPKIMGFAL